MRRQLASQPVSQLLHPLRIFKQVLLRLDEDDMRVNTWMDELMEDGGCTSSVFFVVIMSEG